MNNTNKITKTDSTSPTRDVWKKFRRNKPAVFGLIVIILAIFVSLLGSLIRPDTTPDANNQIPPISKKRPGFKVEQLLLRQNKQVEEIGFWGRMFFGGQPQYYQHIPFYSHKIEGTEVVIEEYTGFKEFEGYNPKHTRYSIAEVVHPIIKDETHPIKSDGKGNLTFYLLNGEKVTESIVELQRKVEKNHIISKIYWLGTDINGRDMLSRLMAGTIVSLSVGLIAVTISILIGLFLGAIAGYYKGWIDDIIMWLINVVWSIPTLLLVIAITMALGKGFEKVFIAVGLTMWVEVARLVRGQVLGLREREFIEAGKAMGFTPFRIIFKHILPNIMGPVIVVSSANFASAILIESGLSFLGIGAQIPMASWGMMIEQHRNFITTDGMAFLAILPSGLIVLMVLAFMLVGNGLRDALDTKM
ncbi:MAG: ABC transporter permease [Flavobacteriales bacterium]